MKPTYEQLEAQVKQLGADSLNLRDVLRQLIAGRPGGVYFIKWEPMIFKALNEASAAEAYLSQLRNEHHAEGANFVANRMLAAWEAGFIDDTAKNAADIARMILTSTEFMADAPEGDFDRSFADGVLEDIAAQLREGKAGEVQS